MELWIQQFGYLAVLVGTFLEGETILVLAGFAAHRGYLHLSGVIIAAFIGTLFGDQLFFYLGWKHSDYLLKRRPHWQPRLERAQRLIRNYQISIMLGFRFLYGLRTITPFALGMSKVPLRLFIPFNVIGALVWAVFFGSAGYLFGRTLEIFLGDVKRYERWAFAALIAISLTGWVIYLVRRKRHSDQNPVPKA
ncbi:DedA family protein [Geopsychrobacter electrodiphilus]|uniref:DedA family protein n=1 Tax=Geopsychrobacter electrodiphilus TaxID=225196 RepID=UPI0003640272|nr:DedA family protein [Geopsychrobacter electrodiphilus]